MMERSSIVYQTFVRILREELIPAMGCTEPIAIAYAAAKAREVLGVMPDKMRIGVSDNIIKNVKSVIVPNTNGLKGIDAAAVAGIVGGRSDKLLQVISEVSSSDKEKMKQYLDTLPIDIYSIDNGIIFDIIIDCYHGEDYARVRICQYHTNIVLIEHNGTVLYESDVSSCEEIKPQGEMGLADKSLLTIKDIIEFADTCDINDVKEVLDTQIDYNRKISNEGLNGDYGANIGSTYLKFYGNDVRNRAIAKAAAGSDARMSGCELPVVINSGSGNQGITASVPLAVYAKEYSINEDKLLRSLILSNLIILEEKKDIGRLSAFCGAISAAVGAVSGICYMLGGTLEEINHTIVNSLAISSGIICDGAKASCAAKIALSLEAAFMGYEMYNNHQEFKAGDGIILKGVDNTIRNVGRLASKGMVETDKEIISMMIENC